jgi:hypothetical protein
MADYTLTWSPASFGGSIAVDGHDLEYTTSEGVSTVVNSDSNVSPNALLNGLSGGEPYTFRVRAKDGSLVGPWSEAVTVTFRVLTSAGDSLQSEGSDYLAWGP